MDPVRYNRHGIPVYREIERCRWPKCQNATVFGMVESLPLCYDHAYKVWQVVEADNSRMRAIVDERRRAHQPPLPPPQPREPVVYYLQIAGHIKIGWTSQLEQRMRSYPPNTILLAVHPGTRQDERQLHKRFAVHRSHGQEWYPLVPVILDHIKRMRAEHGEPPPITFGAKPTEVPTPHRDKPQLRANYGVMLRG